MFRRTAREQEARFSHRWDGRHVVVTLEKAGRTVSPQDWAAAFPAAVCVVADINGAATQPARDRTPLATGTPDAVLLHPEFIAALDVASGKLLGLPPPTSLGLDVKAAGRIDQDDFCLQVRWVRPGGQPVRVTPVGPFLKTADGDRRIPQPLWDLFSAATALMQPTEKAARFERLSQLKSVWPHDPRVPLDSEAYLQDLRIHYASSMSLKLRALTPEHTAFDPVLFGAPTVEDARGANRELDEEADNVLAPSAQKLFAESRFRQDSAARSVYVLRDGEYVFIDPALRPVLTVVRKLQDAPEKDRRAFVLNPRRVIRDQLETADPDRFSLDDIFIETEQFSQRVAGVDIWRKPVLPWLVENAQNRWLPEKFGLRIGDDYFSVAAEKIPELIDRIDAASAECAATADLSGILEPVTPGSPPPIVPVNDATRQAVKSLGSFAPTGMSDVEPDPFVSQTDWDAGKGKLFLVVRDNFEEVGYSPITSQDDVTSDEAVTPPSRVCTALKPHQIDGFAWLAQSALKGLPGALLADDMGLGKTIQAIAFMAWLQDRAKGGACPAAPFLIVAPTGLLGTWKKEIAKHLDAEALGALVPAFGADLKALKEEDSFGERDIETGRASLRNEEWRNAGVVLTTYETLRDYHFSFARTRFGLIVFDEIQKLKNPASQVARAAKALNADFVLGMTGTPVENRLQDLWSIMDVVAPGLLGSSRDFEKRYTAGNKTALAALKRDLTESKGGQPAHILRRMKADQLKDMPKKHVHKYPVDMPPRQAGAYRDLVVRAAAAASAGTLGKGGMLSTLSAMRGVSLHPLDPRQCPADMEEYARDSARLSQVLAILKEVAGRSEKALIFVEDLAMQERLGGLLQKHFSLPSAPMRINGMVSGLKRQEIVDRFELNKDRFDVMILSPKAGGVGLTITSANHVIHLSRWWNPAVEDQATDRVFRIGQKRDVHVYLPMAAHPDADIRASSFDLRLDALIDRKRDLTRDLFFPPEPNDDEFEKFFQEVSMTEGAAKTNGEGDAPSTEVGGDAPETLHASSNQEHREPDLADLPRAVAQSGIRQWRCGAGQPRPTAEIIALFAGEKIGLVSIRDPYALSHRRSRAAQIRFVEQLKAACASLDAVIVEYAPDTDDEPDTAKRQSFTRDYQLAFHRGAPRLLLQTRARRSQGDDFHDRFIEIDTKGPDGAMRRHEITIGRGAEALFDTRWQCTVTYAPPGAQH